MTGVLLLYLFLIVLIRRILLVPVCLRIVVELVILACLRVMCLCLCMLACVINNRLATSSEAN